jgi:hypothetical protein
MREKCERAHNDVFSVATAASVQRFLLKKRMIWYVFIALGAVSGLILSIKERTDLQQQRTKSALLGLV